MDFASRACITLAVFSVIPMRDASYKKKKEKRKRKHIISLVSPSLSFLLPSISGVNVGGGSSTTAIGAGAEEEEEEDAWSVAAWVAA